METINIDSLVVGAGMSGIYATHRLSRMGLSVKCIEIAGDVGGTWYWNRYPGAMSDTETYLYRFSWDKEDLQTYPWSHHYVYQPEILKYLQHITDKHGLRQYMQFNTEMTAAVWDDTAKRWQVTLSTGQVISARYLITCLGILAKANWPKITGLSSFAGELVHTSRWDTNINLEGKRVGIIGNGSTGVQVMTAIAPIVKELKSFQRHPQYSVPSGQKQVPEGYRDTINANYEKIYDELWNSAMGFGVPESTRKTMESTPEERQKAFQEMWNQGNGFRFLLSAFGDLLWDREANEEACKFIRSKIDEIVTDPRKAAALKPYELYARRPLCDAGYYDIFNHDHVDIVDLRETPITEIVPTGIKTSDDRVHELDVLICATGFDAVEGQHLRLRIVGHDGYTIQKHWENGPTAYGSIACPGFPNMFIVAGPQGTFANFPPVIELEVDFIMSCIEHAEKDTASPTAEANGKTANGASSDQRRTIMEALPDAEKAWVKHCEDLMAGSLLKEVPSWINGVNVAGRKATTNFYFGGLKGYSDWMKKEIADGLKGFQRI
ncbi:hypothetical protein PFICI_11131 [Pestalotiopsis fici W106-1]|uniref:FAD/NAD(P)-binding domain-containing protein n=1 Tax=Pestalotiopsis fici (strain W106-1 / CGMCC3.15140) TaxID=1229662 RepID=W3WVX8_PESFW|nr:uncharacterized protein PFICI_11131 [Pestalotiopsis fici W106-1]ETS77257.1 hypothetical protein PFICI_11131 [Pestalotiopsis fici W106-1]